MSQVDVTTTTAPRRPLAVALMAMALLLILLLLGAFCSRHTSFPAANVPAQQTAGPLAKVADWVEPPAAIWIDVLGVTSPAAPSISCPFVSFDTEMILTVPNTPFPEFEADLRAMHDVALLMWEQSDTVPPILVPPATTLTR